MSILAEEYMLDPLTADLRASNVICKWCRAFCSSLLSPLKDSKDSEAALQYVEAFSGSLSLPPDYVGVRERVAALEAGIGASAKSFLPFVPGIILSNLQKSQNLKISGEAVILVADVSGFTRLAERLCKTNRPRDDKLSRRKSSMGADGVEKLTRYLNEFFTQLIDCVHRHGGDVVKFAGDALVCLWFQPSSAEHALHPSLSAAAVFCAAKLKDMVYECDVDDEVVALTLHCGVATGAVGIASVGTGRSASSL